MISISEHDAQTAVCAYLDVQYPDVLYHSCPNGGYLHGTRGQRIGQVNKLKGEGMLPGVADLFIAEPRREWHGFYLEMKAARGILSDNQKWFLAEVERRGYFTGVAYGFEEAKSLLDLYLS